MGGDGGSIPKRRELVKTNRNKEKASKEDNLKSKWQHCALSQEPLQRPVVACQLGRLFNKEPLIHFLLDKSTTNSQFSYISSLKDVKELSLTMNCEYSKAFEKAGSQNMNSEFICPITGIEMSGRFKFVYFFKCGCVLSERAFREIKDNTCTKCNKAFDNDDVIVINGDDDEVASLTEKMNNRKLALKRKRKANQSTLLNDESLSKIAKNNDLEIIATSKLGRVDLIYTNKDEPIESRETVSDFNNKDKESIFCSKISVSGDPNTLEAQNSQSDVTTDDVKSAGDKNEIDDKKLTMKGQGALASRSQNESKRTDSSKADSKPRNRKDKDIKSRSDGKKVGSIQDDPNASAAYKSLFSTHETAKRQAKAHWVTYNPLFY